jgi:hypothetical protein
MAQFDLLDTGQNLGITCGVSASQIFEVWEAGPRLPLTPPVETGATYTHNLADGLDRIANLSQLKGYSASFQAYSEIFFKISIFTACFPIILSSSAI